MMLKENISLVLKNGLQKIYFKPEHTGMSSLIKKIKIFKNFEM